MYKNLKNMSRRCLTASAEVKGLKCQLIGFFDNLVLILDNKTVIARVLKYYLLLTYILLQIVIRISLKIATIS